MRTDLSEGEFFAVRSFGGSGFRIAGAYFLGLSLLSSSQTSLPNRSSLSS